MLTIELWDMSGLMTDTNMANSLQVVMHRLVLGEANTAVRLVG
jgi:hypothetical protein